MPAVIECVPNFSEGRDPATLALLQNAAQSVPGVSLLDIHADADHNRSVFTIAGSPARIAEAAFLLAETAVQAIDLRRHGGVHPRMGAVDVIPFVPIQEVTMDECVEISKAVAERIGRELELPVFLYEKSASAPLRTNLADIRRGGFEKMPQKLTKPEWKPDFGPRHIHPTAGVTAVGARKPLIAFNMHLDTPDIAIAKAIAKAVRASGGGLPYCKAIGLYLESRNTAQVSMNLTDYEQTPMHTVYEQVTAEAARHGVRVTGSELVGLAPMRALTDCAAHFLQMERYEPDEQIIERRIGRTRSEGGGQRHD